MKSRFFRIPSFGVLLLRFGALLSIILLTLLVIVMAGGAIRFFCGSEVGIGEFLFQASWNPRTGSYGARAFIGASLRTAVIAILFAVPWSLALGLYISDYAPENSKRRFRFIQDTLSSIPAIIYGLFALMFVTPLLQGIFGEGRVQPYNTLSAGLVLGIFITPYTTGLLASVLEGKGTDIRFSAMALGATKAEVLIRIVIPDALPGLFSAVLLGFVRALGESIIVGMAAGAGPRQTRDLLVAAETITGFLLRTGSGGQDVIFAFGTLLFLVTIVLNLLGDRISRIVTTEELR